MLYTSLKIVAIDYKKETGINTRCVQDSSDNWTPWCQTYRNTKYVSIDHLKTLSYIKKLDLDRYVASAKTLDKIGLTSTSKAAAITAKAPIAEEIAAEISVASYVTPYVSPLTKISGHPNVFLAPPLINSTLFSDNELGFADIPMRGSNSDRHSLFIHAKKVAEVFGIKNINSTLSNKGSAFVRNEHFITLCVEDCVLNQKILSQSQDCIFIKNMHVNKTSIWLTHAGLIHLLETSQSKNSNLKKFKAWMDETLFALNLGTEKAKVKYLQDNVLHTISISNLQSLMPQASPVECVYLLKLDNIDKLKASGN